MPTTGTIPFSRATDRTHTAIDLAGLLAEHGIQRITLADPRICVSQELASRETDLPRLLLEAHPGTTFSLGEVGLLVDEDTIRWAGDGPLAAALKDWKPPRAEPAAESDPPA